MKKDVGKRIMEFANIVERILTVLYSLYGVLLILGGAGLLFNIEEWYILIAAVISIGLGVLCFMLGRWIAEFLTILTYGFGVLVDRAECLKRDLFEANPNSQITTAPKAAYVPVKPNTNLRDPKPTGEAWRCPNCGYKNGGLTKECSNCYEPRPLK